MGQILDSRGNWISIWSESGVKKKQILSTNPSKHKNLSLWLHLVNDIMWDNLLFIYTYLQWAYINIIEEQGELNFLKVRIEFPKYFVVNLSSEFVKNHFDS